MPSPARVLAVMPDLLPMSPHRTRETDKMLDRDGGWRNLSSGEEPDFFSGKL
jgi:hypothetical protein